MGRKIRRRIWAGLALPKGTSGSARQSKPKGKGQKSKVKSSLAENLLGPEHLQLGITKVMESKTNGSARGLYFCLLNFES